MKLFLITLLFSFSLFAMDRGQITLSGDDGGYLDGKTWSSKDMAGKTTVLFYVDPDEKDKNEEFSEMLKAKNYDNSKINYFAVINMEASGLPNFLISSSIKAKQRKYTSTKYVRDYKKKLVKEWKMKDDENHVLIFSKNGKLLLDHPGKLDEGKRNEAIGLINQDLGF